MIVASSVFKALLKDDPNDSEWRSPYKNLPSSYERRYHLVAGMAISALRVTGRNDEHLKRLAQDVLQAYDDLVEEKHRRELFSLVKTQRPELSDEQADQRVQDFLRRRDIMAEDFLRRVTESPEEYQPMIQEALAELHESMRRDRLW